MNKLELIVAVLSGIGVIGLIVLAILGKGLEPILEIVLMLIAFLIGTKEPAAAAKIAAAKAARSNK